MVQTLTNSLNNELNTDKFKLVFSEIKNTELLCTSANLPGLDGTALPVDNSINKIFVQGNKLNYPPLMLRFKVDENLETFKEIYAWMLSIYAPQTAEQYLKFQKNLKIANFAKGYKFGFDATLFTLSNASNSNIEVQYINLFPTSLTSIDFDLGNTQDPVFATASFQYDYYLIK